MSRNEKLEKEEMSKTDKTRLDYMNDKIESSKYIYTLLKRQNLDAQQEYQEANDNIKQEIQKRLTG